MRYEESLLARAIDYAALQHEKQVDHAGQPFIGHPLRVLAHLISRWGCSEEVQAAAVLHDVVEDTDATIEDVAERFGPEVARIVQALTRRDSETYAEYISRVIEAGPFAIMVKLADNEDNSDQRRATLTETGWMREIIETRYGPARKRLEEALYS